MTVKAYDIFRFEAGQGNFDWFSQPAAVVIPKAGYIYDPTHSGVTSLQPYRSPVTALVGQLVTPEGWLFSQPVLFEHAPMDAPFDQVVFFSAFDQTLLFTVQFPPLTAATEKSFTLLIGNGSLGWCRL